jgi:alpha-1,3-fucosyltransferase
MAPRTPPILVLLYTTVFLNRKFCLSSPDQIFGRSCPSKHQCKWSCNRQLLNEADAIIFHAYDIQYYQASIPHRSQTKSNAIWILWSDEPPSIINYELFKSYRFNWTMSYKLNSEVSLATYGIFSKREQPWSIDQYQRWINEQYQNRTFGALWFVSNCDAKQRLEYFRQLQRQSRLHIEGYGRCVDNYPMHWCQRYTQCEQSYTSKFQFYLSFESTTCRDYVTEKFYKAFYHVLYRLFMDRNASIINV